MKVAKLKMRSQAIIGKSLDDSIFFIQLKCSIALGCFFSLFFGLDEFNVYKSLNKKFVTLIL